MIRTSRSGAKAVVELLEQRWKSTWAALDRRAPAGLFERLLAAWREPQRHYHTLQHLGECLALFEELHAEARQLHEVELALWFHDAVYDVHDHDNEARSAQWAVQALDTAGLDAPCCRRIHDLIMATCNTASPTSADAALLVDVGLAILGAAHRRVLPSTSARFAPSTPGLRRISTRASAWPSWRGFSLVDSSTRRLPCTRGSNNARGRI